MALIARTQVTICDLNDPVVSGEEPSSPVQDMLWMDTSQSPSVLKRWTGEAWEIVSEPEVGGVNLMRGTQDWGESAFNTQGDATVDGDALIVPQGESECISHMISVEPSGKYALGFDVRSDTAYAGVVIRVPVYNAENELIETVLVEADVTAEWMRKTRMMVMPDDADFIYISFSPAGAETKYRSVKFEKGTVATGWTASPEDTASETEKLASRVTKVETDLYDDSILNRVFQSETYVNDQNEITALKEQQAQTQLTLDQYSVEFSSTKEVVDDMDTNFRSWFDFTKEAVLKIGRSDSDFSMSLSNEQLAFYYKTMLAAYMSGSKMYNPNLVVTETLTMGSPDASGSLQAIVDNDGISWI